MPVTWIIVTGHLKFLLSLGQNLIKKKKQKQEINFGKEVEKLELVYIVLGI